MTMKRFTCRVHPGGVFSKPAARGKQPVKCTADYPCDKANDRSQITSTVREVPGVGKVAVITGPRRAPAESNGEAVKADNPSLALARAAMARLKAVGWAVRGRAKVTDGHHGAELTCSRGTETLIMRWIDGELVTQDYSMDVQEESEGLPFTSKLHFDPAALTDSELVKMIKGMRVVWWNTIAGAEEKGTIGNQVTIEHIFRENGDEDETKRIVKFTDHGGGGFRAFHVNALIKVG